MHVSGAPLVSFSCFQCVGCGAEFFRIKPTHPFEKRYGVPYHHELKFSLSVSFAIRKLERFVSTCILTKKKKEMSGFEVNFICFVFYMYKFVHHRV